MKACTLRMRTTLEFAVSFTVPDFRDAMPKLPLPRSIAIAGAWGYIGKKFVDASLALGLRTYVYDPGPPPSDADVRGLTILGNEEDFYHLEADVFHLALHPEHRQQALDVLLGRASRERMMILCEKPMASPERPEECPRMIAAAEASGATVLYDFPELFDPMTRRIGQFLGGFRDVRIAAIRLERSKDREDRANLRNYKRMVPIQYQESVHCLAFVLHLLATVRGGLDPLLAGGLTVEASSEPYDAPNPEAYPYVVDGRCEYALELAGATVQGRTDFKRGASWTKRRTIEGTADGKPFVIEAEYLEGKKHLVLDGEPQAYDPGTNSYEEVICTLGSWQREVDRGRLMRGLYPNPAFARLTYQLSSVLWRSSWDRRRIRLGSREDLEGFDARFAAAVATMPRYPRK
jgi:predicted dehydrogenase